MKSQQSSLIKISLEVGKNPEGGIAVNPLTHKAYVISEQDIEGDDQYAVFVLDSDSLRTMSASKKLTIKLPFAVTYAPKAIPIPNENEYITVDPARNLIYVGTRFTIEQDDTGGDTGGVETDAVGSLEPPPLAPVTTLDPVPVTLGTLTVIDGNTDTVIATWYFELGVEPEGVAVDPATGVVYIGTKAPEGEAPNNDYCQYGTPIYDVGEPGDVECWTSGSIHAFYADPSDTAEPIKHLKEIPAGDDPESVAFQNGMIYAANEDDGTVTIATAVQRDGSGGILVTDLPRPLVDYGLKVFSDPNPKGCLENQFEADKMAAGGGSVFVTDDRSRVAKITGSTVVGVIDIPGATACEYIPNSDGGGRNTANNIAYMERDGGGGLLYVASEQDTVAIIRPKDLSLHGTITVPGAVHLDGIAVDPGDNRVWLTDEALHAVFVLQGACANGTALCRL